MIRRWELRAYSIVTLLLLWTGVASQAGEPRAADAALIAKAREINQALIDGDYGKVADLTYPAVVKGIGGRAKMIATMKASTDAMKSKGISIRSVKVGEPGQRVANAHEVFVIVPITLEIRVPEGTLLKDGFVIAVSNDKGQTWSFINGDVDREQLKKVLPTLPDALKLPDAREPVLEKRQSDA